MLANLSTLFAVALALGTAVQAAPTHTEGKRSTVSNGVTCYYQCPSPSMVTASGESCSVLLSNTGGTCVYTCNFLNGGCTYNTQTGQLTGSSSSSCPATAAMTCGGSGGTGEFKRDKVQRDLTEAERVIAERQFKPAKAIP